MQEQNTGGMLPVTIDLLKTFPALTDVPDNQLEWLLGNSDHHLLKDGELLVRPDTIVAGIHLIINGTCLVYTLQKDQRRDIGVIASREITGYLPYSRGRKTSVNIQASGEVQVMTLPYDEIRNLIRDHFELTQTLVHVMCNRIRYVTSIQLQNEKMMALGKLAAGLAHELNNPAAANLRDAASMISHLRQVPEMLRQLTNRGLSAEETNAIQRFAEQRLIPGGISQKTLKEKTAQEGVLEDLLSDQQVENPESLAETFAEFNISPADLNLLTGQIGENKRSAVLQWLNELLTAYRDAENIQESSHRIAELVRSVKNFTHMDRGADKQRTDIHQGIRNSLVILEHKRKSGHITVLEEYDSALPLVNGLVGELNQVWTNLIDNAMDAMEENGKGVLMLKTEQDANAVKVSVIDDGPGIPDDIRTMIFDPFFTTKPMGRGTGMGLEVVKGIITQHQGSIEVSSVPGCTAFIVRIPLVPES